MLNKPKIRAISVARMIFFIEFCPRMLLWS